MRLQPPAAYLRRTAIATADQRISITRDRGCTGCDMPFSVQSPPRRRLFCGFTEHRRPHLRLRSSTTGLLDPAGCAPGKDGCHLLAPPPQSRCVVTSDCHHPEQLLPWAKQFKPESTRAHRNRRPQWLYAAEAVWIGFEDDRVVGGRNCWWESAVLIVHRLPLIACECLLCNKGFQLPRTGLSQV